MAHHRLLDDLGLSGAAGPDGDAFDDISYEGDLFTFMDIETISSSGPSDRDRDCGAETSSPLCPSTATTTSSTVRLYDDPAAAASENV